MKEEFWRVEEEDWKVRQNRNWQNGLLNEGKSDKIKSEKEIGWTIEGKRMILGIGK